MIEYVVGESRYTIGYQELKEQYQLMLMETDEGFMQELPKAIHLACIICWFKEAGLDASIGDKGIVHELAHLLHLGDEVEVNGNSRIKNVRKLFKEILELK